MGLIIPATVACTCPRTQATREPPSETRLSLHQGSWRLDPDPDGALLHAWAPGACPHGLVLAEAWPLLSALIDLGAFLRRRPSPDRVALGELLAAFGRRPDEEGELRPATFVVDERHRRALAGLAEALAAESAGYLVDADTYAVLARPSGIESRSDRPLANGWVLVRTPDPGPPYSAYARFDLAGLCIESDDGREWRSLHFIQELDDGRARLVDVDSGAAVELPGVVIPGFGQTPSRCMRVEARSLTDEYLAELRRDLAMLVDAAIATGHPIRLPDRFG